jgi:hypothetical protein
VADPLAQRPLGERRRRRQDSYLAGLHRYRRRLIRENALRGSHTHSPLSRTLSLSRFKFAAGDSSDMGPARASSPSFAAYQPSAWRRGRPPPPDHTHSLAGGTATRPPAQPSRRRRRRPKRVLPPSRSTAKSQRPRRRDKRREEEETKEEEQEDSWGGGSWGGGGEEESFAPLAELELDFGNMGPSAHVSPCLTPRLRRAPAAALLLRAASHCRPGRPSSKEDRSRTVKPRRNIKKS